MKQKGKAARFMETGAGMVSRVGGKGRIVPYVKDLELAGGGYGTHESRRHRTESSFVN